MQKDTFLERLDLDFGAWSKNPEESPFYDGKMTKELYPYTKLFEPIQVNKLKIKNRLVMAPMGNIDMCEETGRPNAKMLAYFKRRAQGGVGLITTGLVPVSHGIDPTVTEKDGLSYFPRIDRSRTVYAGWRDLAQEMHVYGARVFIQLTAGLGRVGNPECLMTLKKLPVSASHNGDFYISDIPCARLSDGQCKKIIKNMGQASADAKASGIDGVYLHGHEGYLLDQMTNPAFNRRKIGRYREWQKFGLDMVTEIRARVGNDYPIMYRIDLSAMLNETYDKDMSEKSLNKFVNGRQIEDTLLYMENLVKAGVDMFDVDLGCYDNWWLPHPPAQMPAGCFLSIARVAKKYFEERHLLSNAGYAVPIVAVGKLGYPDVAEDALREEMCDMIMLGRPLLADPDWPNKVYNGKVEEICPCVGCQEGCINEFVNGGHPQCAVNAETGFEDVTNKFDATAEKKKKIAVIGAGPAGCAFALEAARRGHTITIFDQNEKIGGKLLAASVPNNKFDVANYVDYLQYKIQHTEGIEVQMGREVTANDFVEQGYDAIVTAMGYSSGRLNLGDDTSVPAATAEEVLLHPERFMDENGAVKKAFIVGGGQVGCETAYWLKLEKGWDVTVAEMTPYFMNGVCTANRGYMLHYLKESGVKLINCASVVGTENGQVIYSHNTHKSVPNPYDSWTPILPPNVKNPLAKKIKEKFAEERENADLVIFAVGGRPSTRLYDDLVRRHLAPEVYNIGDSFSAGRILEATRAGYRLGRQI